MEKSPFNIQPMSHSQTKQDIQKFNLTIIYLSSGILNKLYSVDLTTDAKSSPCDKLKLETKV